MGRDHLDECNEDLTFVTQGGKLRRDSYSSLLSQEQASEGTNRFFGEDSCAFWSCSFLI